MGGASTRVSNAIKGLRERGHEIFVVTAFPHYPHGRIPREYRGRAFALEGEGKVKVLRVWVPPLPHEGAKRLVMYLSFTLFSLIGMLFCGKVDVVWAVSPNYFSSITGIFYKMVKRKPLVLDVVDLWPEALVNLGFLKSKFLVGLVNVAVDLSYRFSDGIITLNLGMKREILRREKNPSKVFIVENVVDTNIFKPSAVGKSKNFSDKFVVMYIGNLGKAQDFDTILESAKILKDIDPDILFFVKGEGDSESEIAKKIGKFKLRNVILSNATVPLTKVPDYLNLADILLLPLKKGFGNISFPSKLWEYLACKKPVIACVEGNIAGFIENKKIGIVVAPSDGVALSRSILELKKSPQLGDIIATNGFTFVIKNLSLDIFAEKLLHCFEQNVSKEHDFIAFNNSK
jgi:glycosyltransferase involved in cell wall biosynthesis